MRLQTGHWNNVIAKAQMLYESYNILTQRHKHEFSVFNFNHLLVAIATNKGFQNVAWHSNAEFGVSLENPSKHALKIFTLSAKKFLLKRLNSALECQATFWKLAASITVEDRHFPEIALFNKP